MANDEHLGQLKNGADDWNAWRAENRNISPDLSGSKLRGERLGKANLTGADLSGADLGRADLSGAYLRGAILRWADLGGADLPWANLIGADLRGANLGGAILREANLIKADLGGANLGWATLGRANLREANLTGADLRGAKNLGRANLSGADLCGANLSKVDLSRADLFGANLNDVNLSEAKLGGADLRSATLVNTDLRGADLTGCRTYGVSAWNLKLERTKQQNLVITSEKEPEITVDNIEVAQFIYLLLQNEKIRNVIDTVTSKAVLILGRFTDERKKILDALRDELRKRDYLPILFDFDKPTSQTTDETITLLARMSRFVIADISDAKSVLQELRAIVPDLPSVPVQPVITATQEEPGMFDFFRKFRSFLEVHHYNNQQQLIDELGDRVIDPAEKWRLVWGASAGPTGPR
jgi:uncharacterized protein YjbI with pentapeptide repeats